MLRSLLLRFVLPGVFAVAVLEGVGCLLVGDEVESAGEATTRLLNERFYEYDRDLIVRLRPNGEFDYRSLRADIPARMTTNSEGFRGAEFPPPDPDAFRVVVFGDSVAFGLGMPDGESWPRRLEALLRDAAGGKPVQVRNYAVPGYSTFQGAILFERVIAGGEFAPDVAICAFGFNDGSLRYADDETSRVEQRARYEGLSSWLPVLRRNSYFFAAMLPRPQLPERHRLRVAPDQLRGYLAAISTCADAHGVPVLWVDSCLPFAYVRDAFESVARSRGETALALRDLYRAHTSSLPHEGPWPEGGRLRLELNARPTPPPPSPDDRPQVYALWLPTVEDRESPQRIALADDGMGADLVAGDGIWSGMVAVAPGARPEVAFVMPGFGEHSPSMRDDADRLNGQLDQPGPTTPVGPDGVPTFRRRVIEHLPWQDLVLWPDVVHTSPAGASVIATGVAAVMIESPVFRAFVAR